MKGVLYTSMSDERIRLSNSVVFCVSASVQCCSGQMNRLYGLGLLIFNICPIISFLSVHHFFQYLFLYSYSLLPSVTSYFNTGTCLADTWQLGCSVGKREELCRTCGCVDCILEGITFTGYYSLPTPHNGKKSVFPWLPSLCWNGLQLIKPQKSIPELQPWFLMCVGYAG